jgi:hypothetical protein
MKYFNFKQEIANFNLEGVLTGAWIINKLCLFTTRINDIDKFHLNNICFEINHNIFEILSESAFIDMKFDKIFQFSFGNNQDNHKLIFRNDVVDSYIFDEKYFFKDKKLDIAYKDNIDNVLFFESGFFIYILNGTLYCNDDIILQYFDKVPSIEVICIYKNNIYINIDNKIYKNNKLLCNFNMNKFIDDFIINP